MSQESEVAELSQRLERLRGYLRADPANPALAKEAAALALRLGRPAEARELISVCQAAGVFDVGLTHLMGMSFLADARWDEALASFRELTDAGHDHPGIRYNIAHALNGRGDREAALAMLKAFSPEELVAVPEVHSLLSDIAHFQEDLEESARQLQLYLQARPGDARARSRLALVLFDGDRTEEAREIAQERLAENPRDADAQLVLGSIALEEKDARQTLEYLQPLVEAWPQHGRAWSAIGFARMLNSEFDEAKTAFEHAVQHMPNHIGTWHGYGWLQLLQGDIEAAESSFQSAMALDRNFGESHGALGLIAVLKGRLDDSEPMLRRAQGLNPQGFTARYARTLLTDKRGDAESAKQQLQKLLASHAPGSELSLQDMAAQFLARRTGGGSRGPNRPR